MSSIINAIVDGFVTAAEAGEKVEDEIEAEEKAELSSGEKEKLAKLAKAQEKKKAVKRTRKTVKKS